MSFSAASLVTAVSDFTSKRTSLCFPGVHPVTVYNGIDTGFFAPSSETRSSTRRFRILFLGNTSKRKGFNLLSVIMKKLGDEYELYYSIGLRGKKKQAVNENIVCLGSIGEKNLPALYRACDAVIVPSRYEGFGYVACEAMACGKPVVASDNSSLAEMVRDQETGFLCPVNDVDAFVRAIERLASDSEMARRLGQAGRDRVLQNFKLEAMTAKYIDLYHSMLS